MKNLERIGRVGTAIALGLALNFGPDQGRGSAGDIPKCPAGISPIGTCLPTPTTPDIVATVRAVLTAGTTPISTPTPDIPATVRAALTASLNRDPIVTNTPVPPNLEATRVAIEEAVVKELANRRTTMTARSETATAEARPERPTPTPTPVEIHRVWGFPWDPPWGIILGGLAGSLITSMVWSGRIRDKWFIIR